MVYQAIFRRYELKFLLNVSQKDALMQAMAPYMAPDQYGRTCICNLYYDTDTYRLIRRSIERPIYKEKLRLRSYGTPTDDAHVFVELKKKYQGVVYKRRVALPQETAIQWLQGSLCPDPNSQIGQEVDYFLSYYGTLQPRVYLSYQREAWYARDGSDFRVTFDDTILCRTDHLSLSAGSWGTPLLGEDQVLMEVKTSGGIPLWMTQHLTANRIFQTSFSKYGTAYRTMIQPYLKGGHIHA